MSVKVASFATFEQISCLLFSVFYGAIVWKLFFFCARKYLAMKRDATEMSLPSSGDHAGSSQHLPDAKRAPLAQQFHKF